ELPLPVTQIKMTPPPDIRDLLEPREIQEALTNTGLFRNALSTEEREALGADCHPIELPKGSVLMRQGDAAVSMFIVLEGAISVAIHSASGKQKQRALSAAVDLVGAIPHTPRAPRTSTVTDLTRFRAPKIPRETND